jgi:hypothetical protein
MFNRRGALAALLAAPMIERARADKDAFFEWMNMYQDRISSVTGIAVTTLFSDEDPEGFEAHYDACWQRFSSGLDAVDCADGDLKPQKATQSAEDFRREWREAQARFESTHG